MRKFSISLQQVPELRQQPRRHKERIGIPLHSRGLLLPGLATLCLVSKVLPCEQASVSVEVNSQGSSSSVAAVQG